MRNRILLFIILVQFNEASAQTAVVDSLLNIFNDETATDTARLDALNICAAEGAFMSGKKGRATIYNMQVDFAKNNESMLANLFVEYMRPLNELPIDSQISIRLKQLNALENSSSFRLQCLVTASIVDLYGYKSDFSNSEIFVGQLVELVQNNIHPFYKSVSFSSVCQHYLHSQNLLEAYKYATLSIENANLSGSKGLLGVSFHALADIFLQALDVSKSEHYHEMALRIFEKNAHPLGVASIVFHQASEYYYAKEYQKCRDLLDRIRKEDIYKFDNAANAFATFHVLKAICSAHLKDESEYNDHMAQSKKWAVDFNHPSTREKLHFAETIMAFEKKESLKALALCDVYFDKYSAFTPIKRLLALAETAHETAKALGEKDRSYIYLEKLYSLKDSMTADNATATIAGLEIKKQIVKDSLAHVAKEQLIQRAHDTEIAKKDKTRNIAIAIGVLVLLIAAGLFSRLRYVRKSKAIIESERDRSDNLLLNILPADIAKELKEKGKADARDFDMVSILFTDFKEFTQAAEKLTAAELVNEINACFEAFDSIMAKYKIEKIKTIGDAYMAAGGLPIPTDDSAKNTVLAALEMQAFITKRQVENKAENKPAFEMRLGIHTGPVVAGIVGVKKFQYDIWGDTVNTASRMESHGEVGKVNISEATFQIIKDEPEFIFDERAELEVKGKGRMKMFFTSITKKTF